MATVACVKSIYFSLPTQHLHHQVRNDCFNRTFDACVVNHTVLLLLPLLVESHPLRLQLTLCISFIFIKFYIYTVSTLLVSLGSFIVCSDHIRIPLSERENSRPFFVCLT